MTGLTLDAGALIALEQNDRRLIAALREGQRSPQPIGPAPPPPRGQRTSHLPSAR